MRFLNQFNEFNFVQFSEGKTFNVVEVAPWQDYKTKELLGTEVTVVIMTDNTNYGEKKTGTNRFEKLKFKLRKQVDVPVDAKDIELFDSLPRIHLYCCHVVISDGKLVILWFTELSLPIIRHFTIVSYPQKGR